MTSLSGVAITSMAYGGAGIARVDGKVIFVEGALEGDVCDIILTKSKRSFAKGHLAKLVSPSPYRRPSPCASADQCGGCPLIMAAESRQRHWKKDFAVSSLAKLSGLDRAGLDQLAGDVIAAEPLGYRHRVTLKVGVQDQQLVIGFFGRRSHRIVPIGDCPVASPAVQKVIAYLANAFRGQKLPQRPKARGKGSHRRLVFDLQLQQVQSPDAGQDDQGGLQQPQLGQSVIATLFSEQSALGLEALARRFPVLKPLVAALKRCPDVVWWGSSADSLSVLTGKSSSVSLPAQGFCYDQHEGISYQTFPGLFQQAHLGVNRQMRAIVHSALKGCDTVLDLFCGSGNLSLGLNADVLGVECVALSIAAAKASVDRSFAQASPPRHRYEAHPAEAFLARYQDAPTPPFAGIVSDPPRAGHGALIQLLLALKAPILVLVGCDPMNLARDVTACLGSGYRLVGLHVFDAFAQTDHVETMAILHHVPENQG